MSGLVCAGRMVCAVGGGWLRKAVLVAKRYSGFRSPQFCSGMRFPF